MSNDDALADYKEQVVPLNKGTLTWDRDLVFTATTQRGYDIEFDAEMEWGCMPVEGVLLSLAGCMAIDVVSILTKMRCPPETLRVEIEAERADGHPKVYTAIRLRYVVTGDVKNDEVVAQIRDAYAKCKARAIPPTASMLSGTSI